MTLGLPQVDIAPWEARWYTSPLAAVMGTLGAPFIARGCRMPRCPGSADAFITPPHYTTLV
jgi:hypothetical protein